VRRGILAVVLIGAAVIPGRASSQSNPHCTGSRCSSLGAILWTRRLSGSWVAEDGVAGTEPAQGDAYVAATASLAVLGSGTSVTAYSVMTGEPAWNTVLAGFPPGAAIVSVRAWPSVVAVGVAVPGTLGRQSWSEVILSAATGIQIRSFPSAASGGAVWASKSATVVVSAAAVTGYANATGRVLWRRATGAVPQAWKVSGQYLFVEEAAGGYLSSSPVTALRRISLRTGGERTVRPPGRAYAGTLAGVVGNVALFDNSDGLSGYSALTGRMLWPTKPGVVPELTDAARQIVYVSTGDILTGLHVGTGLRAGPPVNAPSESLYAISDGVALGLDQAQGNLGDAWGYSMTSKRIVWTSPALPWPHFFVDMTGLGGSISSPRGITLLTTCAAQGAASGNNGPACIRPELAAIKY
jgi:hypothetical protein